MFEAVPPWMVPKLAVVSASMRPLGTRARARAASSTAFTPHSGWSPAWAATPVTVMVRRLAAGAWVITRAKPLESSAYPSRARTRSGSRALAPTRPISSQVVMTNSTGRCGVPVSCSRRRASMQAAMPDLSSLPRMVSPALVNRSPSRRTRTPSAGSTVSMWQLRKIGSTSSPPSKRTTRLPHSAPVSAAESSSMISAAPSSWNSSCSRREILPSRRDGLSISQSSVKLAASRSLFTSMQTP